MDPPAGVEIREGMNYNPFFPGGGISMARVLFDGLVEYDDSEFLFCSVSEENDLCSVRNTCDDKSDGQRCRDVPQLGSRA
jgi:hypothetical protein